jgi:hypothetical protein
MFKIKVPSKNFEGQRCGVQFRKGEAIVEDKALADKLEAMGYEVESLVKEEPKEAPKKAPRKKATTKAKGE